MPKMTIEPNEAEDVTTVATPSQQVEAGGEERPQDAPKEMDHALRAARSWVSKNFPGRENAFYGGVAGLVVALLVFAIGIGRTLFIGLLVLVGIAVGQAADGDPKIIRTIRGYIESRSNR